MRIHG
ncbi:Protein of unknown function, partial [Gryllus bimaculatus]